VAAEPTRLSWLIGTSSQEGLGNSRLWNRIEGEQSFAQERFFAAADLKTQSLLSGSSRWGTSLGVGADFSLQSSFEWMPCLRWEKDPSISGWDAVFQSGLRYRLWALQLESQVAVGLWERLDSRLFRLRQSAGLSLGETPSREDFVFVDLEFQDRLQSSGGTRAPVKRVGLSFVSRVEF
jgi:hypothetical protein